MYDKQSPAQQNNLILGSKIRVIRNSQNVIAHHGEHCPFSTEEAEHLARICDHAETRAKEVHKQTAARLAEADANKRPEAEHRQYNGK